MPKVACHQARLSAVVAYSAVAGCRVGERVAVGAGVLEPGEVAAHPGGVGAAGVRVQHGRGGELAGIAGVHGGSAAGPGRAAAVRWASCYLKWRAGRPAG